MLTKDTFRDMLKKLLDKSRKELVNWQPTQETGDYWHGTTTTTPPPLTEYRGTSSGWSYVVEFDRGNRIRITFESPAAAPDRACAALTVGNRTLVELDAEDGDQTGDFELLNKLVLEAGRHVEGWDKAVQQIEQQLDSDQPVGTAATSGR